MGGPKQVSNLDNKNKEPTELEILIDEKVTLSQKLGIMGDLKPVKGYKETNEYKRINEIDLRLWELVK